MHESAIAHSLLDAILAEAAKKHAKPIGAKISCGMMNAVNDEILCFAFEAIAKGTRCEGLKLEVQHNPMQAKCEACGEIFVFDIFQPACPKCGSNEFELLPDKPLMLEEIELDLEISNEN